MQLYSMVQMKEGGKLRYKLLPVHRSIHDEGTIAYYLVGMTIFGAHGGRSYEWFVG